MIILCVVDIIRKYIISIVSFCAGISFNQYLTYLPVPVLPSPECNSSSLYNGHVTDSMLCSMANGDSRVCHVRNSPAANLSFKRTFAKLKLHNHGVVR